MKTQKFSDSIANFFMTFYKIRMNEGMRDVEYTIWRAARENGIRLEEARDAFKEVLEKDVNTLASTNEHQVAVFFKINAQKLVQIANQMIEFDQKNTNLNSAK